MFVGVFPIDVLLVGAYAVLSETTINCCWRITKTREYILLQVIG